MLLVTTWKWGGWPRVKEGSLGGGAAGAQLAVTAVALSRAARELGMDSRSVNGCGWAATAGWYLDWAPGE